MASTNAYFVSVRYREDLQFDCGELLLRRHLLFAHRCIISSMSSTSLRRKKSFVSMSLVLRCVPLLRASRCSTRTSASARPQCTSMSRCTCPDVGIRRFCESGKGMVTSLAGTPAKHACMRVQQR
eukprot:353839-Chlamydomonas_euryale.AAC.18